MIYWLLLLNILRVIQNGSHFADDIFKLIFLYENCCILIEILLKYVAKGPINNMTALAQIIADNGSLKNRQQSHYQNQGLLSAYWCIYGHVTQPAWVKSGTPLIPDYLCLWWVTIKSSVIYNIFKETWKFFSSFPIKMLMLTVNITTPNIHFISFNNFTGITALS